MWILVSLDEDKHALRSAGYTKLVEYYLNTPRPACSSVVVVEAEEHPGL